MRLEPLVRFVTEAILSYLKGVTSIIIHGSASRNEASLFLDEEEDILLGNIGFTVVTKSLIQDVLSYILLSHFLRNIEKSNLSEVIQKPLILLFGLIGVLLKYILIISKPFIDFFPLTEHLIVNEATAPYCFVNLSPLRLVRIYSNIESSNHLYLKERIIL